MDFFPKAIFVRIVVANNNYINELTNCDLKTAVSYLTGQPKNRLPTDSTSLIEKWKRRGRKQNSVQKFHQYLFDVNFFGDDFVLTLQLDSYRVYQLNFTLLDYDNTCAGNVARMIVKCNKSKLIFLNVSGLALYIFVRYLKMRFLSVEEVMANLECAWEICFLSDYFGVDPLLCLMSGILSVAMHKIGNLEIDDYLYSFLYSVLYSMPVVSEKLLPTVMAIIGQQTNLTTDHPALKTLKFVKPNIHNRICSLLENYPNYFSNCQFECSSSNAYYQFVNI